MVNSTPIRVEASYGVVLGKAKEAERTLLQGSAIPQSLATALTGFRLLQKRRFSESLLTAQVDRIRGYSYVKKVTFDYREPETLWLPFKRVRQPIPAHVRRDVLSVGLCAHCGTTERLTVDHVTPWSWGGSDDRENLQCLCLPCNIRKRDRHNH